MISWGWVQRGKGNPADFLLSELEMKLEGSFLRSSRRLWIHLQPTCCPERSGPGVSRGCLLRLGSRAKRQVGAGREVSLRYSAAEVGMRVGDWILGNREEKVSEQLTWFSGRCGLWFSTVCLLGLEAGTQ